MGRGKDNYFLILELDFMEELSDEEITARIDEKERYWRKYSEIGRNKDKCRLYKSWVPQIRKVMGDRSSRMAEASDARVFVEGVLNNKMRYFRGQDEIEKKAAKSIMESCNLGPKCLRK